MGLIASVSRDIGRDGALVVASLLALALMWALWSANKEFLKAWLSWRACRPDFGKYDGNVERFRRDLSIWQERRPMQ